MSLVVIVIFGASKLPDIARNLGKSAKILKKEMRELNEDDSAQSPQLQEPPAQQNSAEDRGNSSDDNPRPRE